MHVYHEIFVTEVSKVASLLENLFFLALIL